MKKLQLVAAVLLLTLTTSLQTHANSWVISDEAVIAEGLQERYGCSVIFQIERSWHNVYTKDGCESFTTPRYGYAIEQVRKSLRKLKLSSVFIRIQNTSEQPFGSVIGGAGKYSDHLNILFLRSLNEYDTKIWPAYVNDYLKQK